MTSSVISFSDLPVDEQFGSGSHAVSQTYVPLSATPHNGKQPFRGQLVSQALGSAHISEISGGPAK